MVFVLCLISCIYIPHDLLNILANWYALHNTGWGIKEFHTKGLKVSLKMSLQILHLKLEHWKLLKQTGNMNHVPMARMASLELPRIEHAPTVAQPNPLPRADVNIFDNIEFPEDGNDEAGDWRPDVT